MKVWVTRDGCKSAAVTLWNGSKPVRNREGFFYPNYEAGDCMNSQMEVWTQAEFRIEFGFTPRKGSIKQMELSLSEIE